MGTKPQQQLQRAAEGGEPGLFADWQPSWRNPAASGNSRAARAGQDEPIPLLEEQLAVLQREHNRSEEHTSELQSLAYLVCRLLLEKKKKKKNSSTSERRLHHRGTTNV